MRRIILLFVVILLSACSGGGGSGPTTSLPPPNSAPTVNAGADQIVDEGATVDLAGTGTDSDGNIVSYRWRQDSGPACYF